MLKYFYYLLISLGLVLFAQSFFSAFEFFAHLNLLLVFLIFVTIIFGFNLGFIFSIFIGFFLNIYSFLPFGTFIVIYLIIIAVVNFSYKHVFINFSFFTNLILIVSATCLYGILLLLANFIFYALGLVSIYTSLDWEFLKNLFLQIVFNLILMSLIYFIAKKVVKTLNLALLIKK